MWSGDNVLGIWNVARVVIPGNGGAHDWDGIHGPFLPPCMVNNGRLFDGVLMLRGW